MIDRTRRREQQNAGRRRKKRPIHGRRSVAIQMDAARKRARRRRKAS